MYFVVSIVPLLLLLLGFPVFVVLLASAAIAILAFTNVPPTILHQVLFGSLDNYTLLAVPFFIYAGELMGRGGISRRLVIWSQSLIGGMRGSLPITGVATSTVFGAISGSSPATVAAVGRILYAPMREEQYSRQFSVGVLTASGVIANIIPPSVAMLLYAAAAEQSVIRLFTAGILPGLLFAILFCVYAWLVARGQFGRREWSFDWGRFLAASRSAGWALFTPVIILGGIYAGIFSPTEAAGISCVYAILVTMFVYRELGVRELLEVTQRAMFVTAQIMIIVASAGVFSWVLTTSGVASAAAEWIEGMNLPGWMMFLAINIFLLIVGCFLDTASSILVLTPLLVPIAVALDIDLVHFGIVMTVNLSIGMFTPPFGLNIFVGQATFQEPVQAIYRGVLPFIGLSFVALAIITYVPELSLALTRFLD